MNLVNFAGPVTYHNASHYGPGINFFPAAFTLPTKCHRHLLFEVLNQRFWAMNNSSWRRSLPTNPHDKFAVAVIKDSKIVDLILSEKLFKYCLVLYYAGNISMYNFIFHTIQWVCTYCIVSYL